MASKVGAYTDHTDDASLKQPHILITGSLTPIVVVV